MTTLGFLSAARAGMMAHRSAAEAISTVRPYLIRLCFMVFLLSVWFRCSSIYGSCSKTTPSTPVHLRILVHLSGFEILLRKFICAAELLVSLVLLRSTDIGPILSRVWENVVRFPLFVDHGYLAWRKLLELLLLRRRLGGDRLKAGGHQHALSVLGAALCGGAAEGQR